MSWMHRLRILGMTAVLPLLVGNVFAWGVEGHKAIAEIARGRLNIKARAAVSELLGNDDLAAVAVWADEARSAVFHKGPLASDPEAHHFNEAFPHNQNWHFVNLPLGLAYDPNGLFSSKDDVVHAINRCVAVLEGRSEELSRELALKLLIHFVGDLHQPLHAASGYYDLSDLEMPKLVTDPARVNISTSDRGANDLHFGRSEELHAYWDDTLVEMQGAGRDYLALAVRIAGRPEGVVRASDELIVPTLNFVATHDAGSWSWQTPGDYHGWAAAWATESSAAARAAYEGITFGKATLGRSGQLMRIEIRLPDGYAERSEPVVAERLHRAGARLAELLNRILGA